MKQRIYALAIIICASVAVFAQSETLRGDAAINELKQTGQYNSLIEAVRDVRKENGQTDEPNTEDPIGQTAKLLATDGAASDNLGFSVAISGDTVTIP